MSVLGLIGSTRRVYIIFKATILFHLSEMEMIYLHSYP